MASHKPPSLKPVSGGQWTATAQTPVGPVTAIGDSIAEARTALDQLLVIARAMELSRRHRER